MNSGFSIRQAMDEWFRFPLSIIHCLIAENQAQKFSGILAPWPDFFGIF
jgi:hypothetical protein